MKTCFFKLPETSPPRKFLTRGAASTKIPKVLIRGGKATIVKSLEDVESEEKEHSIDWAIENIRATNCYEGWEEELRYLMYRYEEDKAPHRYTNEQWNCIWQESASHSIEHISSQNSNQSFVHNLGNLLLLPPGLNSKLQDRKPTEKVKEYRDTGLYIAREVAEVIEAQGWGEVTDKVPGGEVTFVGKGNLG